MSLALLLGLLACTQPVSKPDETDLDSSSNADSPGESQPDTAPVLDTSADTSGDSTPDTGETSDPDEDGPEGCDDLYDPDLMPAFEVEISDAEWSKLLRDYARGDKEYHPIVFRYDGEEVSDAMIRLKGNPSFSWFTDKLQFVIAFNEVDRDGRFHGLRKLALDASWYEPTLLRDRLAWSMIRRQGELPAACANSATLTINGEYYGLYTNIEYFDHEWLERAFGKDDATGTLWKYGYDAVSNEEAATGSVDAMWATTNIDRLTGLGDLDEWELMWAAEIALGDDDGYWCCNHNFYLYEHPSRGVLFVPWDLDDAFDVQGYDVDPIAGYYDGLFRQEHFGALARDPVWGPKLIDQIEAMNEALDPAGMDAEIVAWSAQIEAAFLADPNRSVGVEEHAGAVQRLRDWIPARHAFLKSWVACARGEDTDADGDGAAVCDDPNDDDPSVFPGGTETCDGVDEDVNGVVDDDAGCDDCARHDVDDSHFLFCRDGRTQAKAEANCEALGGELSAYATTAEYYLYFFCTWPVFESWWTGAATGARCPTFEGGSASTGTASCSEEHPSICRLP